MRGRGSGKEMGTLPAAVVPTGYLVGVAEGAGAHSAVAPFLVVCCGVRGSSEYGTVVRGRGALVIEGASHLAIGLAVCPMSHCVGFASCTA